MYKVKASAFANVALVKYFGKRNKRLNLPAGPSISLTLEPLETITELKINTKLATDTAYINGEVASEKFMMRVRDFLDVAIGKKRPRLCIETINNFPTAAGLASSASGFAALAVAVNEFFNINLSQEQLSILARRGSGSASRSIPGGIVLWKKGQQKDGLDSFAQTIVPFDYWDLRIVVGITEPGPKEIGSTDAMELTRKTSPFYSRWIKRTDQDCEEAQKAILRRDIETLGHVAEASALSMHAAVMAASPGLVFFKGATIDAYHMVKNLRKKAILAFFTCDAGPQPKILCEAKDVELVKKNLADLPGITRIISCKIAHGARVLASSK
jgi:diphosphomevalonate decarboxylase